jgi:hypothetical protein
MDYKKIHDQIINRAKDRELNEYSESHHIIPRCLGGTDDPGNLVRLTAREHFIIHWLLTLIHPYENPLKFAFWNMCQRGHSSQMRYVPSSRIYEWARLQLKGIPKPNGFQVGEGNTFYGKQHSDDSKLKISKSLKGREFSEEHRKKLSESAKKRKGNKPNPHKGKRYEEFMDPERAKRIKNNISEKLKGKSLPDETRKKISKALKGKKLGPISDDHREALKHAFKERDKQKKLEADNKWMSLLDLEIKKGLTDDNYSDVMKYFNKIKYRGLDISEYEWLIPKLKKIEFMRRSKSQNKRNKK